MQTFQYKSAVVGWDMHFDVNDDGITNLRKETSVKWSDVREVQFVSNPVKGRMMDNLIFVSEVGKFAIGSNNTHNSDHRRVFFNLCLTALDKLENRNPNVKVTQNKVDRIGGMLLSLFMGAGGLFLSGKMFLAMIERFHWLPLLFFVIAGLFGVRGSFMFLAELKSGKDTLDLSSIRGQIEMNFRAHYS